MGIKKLQALNVDYCRALKNQWQGRSSNPDMENQYWHQEIELVDIAHMEKENQKEKKIDVALLGYVCDEGVKRNRGRVGANEGPKAVRERLAKLPIHFDSKRVVDVGDIFCNGNDMEACQEGFSIIISNLINRNIFPIAIGGGHDISYGNFRGILSAVNESSKKIGVINFDAHFDLRPKEKKGNSGTPFNQLISEFEEQIKYFVIGIQQQSNTKELFEIAKSNGVGYAINYDCESSVMELKALKTKLNPFIESCDYLYVTIDMDGFSSAYAPGVSAPSPLGFTPYFVFKMLSFLFNTKKIISFDIAELNPLLDRDNLTANLAAKIVDFVVMKHSS